MASGALCSAWRSPVAYVENWASGLCSMHASSDAVVSMWSRRSAFMGQYVQRHAHLDVQPPPRSLWGHYSPYCQWADKQKTEGRGGGVPITGAWSGYFSFLLRGKRGVAGDTFDEWTPATIHILGLKTYFLFPPQALILSGSLQASQCFDSLGICSLMWTQLQEMTTILDPKNKIK